MSNIKMEPSSSLLQYTHLLKMKQEELTSVFISSFIEKNVFIFSPTYLDGSND